MSRASDILNEPKLTASDILDTNKSKAVNESAYGTRIVSGLIDTAARYRSTQKLEYKLNLIMTAVMYSAAASIEDDSDKNRLISIASSLNREYGNIKEISDMSTILNFIYNRVK